MNVQTLDQKPFSWSYSKLKNFETCPRRYNEVDVTKNFREAESEALSWGNEVHKAAELYLTKGTKLPIGMPALQSWLDKLKEIKYDQILVEQKLAIDKNFSACGYYDSNAWFRTKADVIGIKEPVALSLDWKTGKLIDDSQQLALLASCCFAHLPQIHKLRTEFIWLKEGPNVSSRKDFDRKDMVSVWRGIWPRIEALELAYNTKNYPPRPGALCRRWCPVSSCEYHGH